MTKVTGKAMQLFLRDELGLAVGDLAVAALGQAALAARGDIEHIQIATADISHELAVGERCGS